MSTSTAATTTATRRARDRLRPPGAGQVIGTLWASGATCNFRFSQGDSASHVPDQMLERLQWVHQAAWDGEQALLDERAAHQDTKRELDEAKAALDQEQRQRGETDRQLTQVNRELANMQEELEAARKMLDDFAALSHKFSDLVEKVPGPGSRRR
ncbi:hypothetical protein OC844_005022 [Tilletia horrida]|nr:hypothetical protein OC844_005022 [Tilletia horrida]